MARRERKSLPKGRRTLSFLGRLLVQGSVPRNHRPRIAETMKIHTLPVQRQFQPEKQPFRYPSHNNDFGVEQDFLRYLLRHGDLKSSSPVAEWHYLPVSWTRWHLSHDYAKTGLVELQQEVDRVILDDRKTFTICQYDDGPVVELGETTVFLASRKTSWGIDIPLLCSPHRKPFFPIRKKYLASFVGRLSTHPSRQEMFEELKKRTDIYIHDGDAGTKFYVRRMLESWIALCPRGYGGSSFRFFEAMQLGVVPCLIGDLDTRPFKEFIDWSACSLYSQGASNLGAELDAISQTDLASLGRRAKVTWETLKYQKWCDYVIQELRVLK